MHPLRLGLGVVFGVFIATTTTALAQPADYPRCIPNHRYSGMPTIGGFQFLVSPEFDVQAKDRIFVRGRGRVPSNYSVGYYLQQKVGTVWLTRAGHTPGTPSVPSADGDVQRLVRTDQAGTYRLYMANPTSNPATISVDMVVVWHEEPSCRDAYDIKPNTEREDLPVDACFGAAGGNCAGMSGDPVFVGAFGQRWLRNAPGAQKHDTCCNVQRSFWSKRNGAGCFIGPSFAYDYSPVIEDPAACDVEFATAGVDVLNSFGTWQWFNAATIYLTGVHMATRGSFPGDFISPGPDTMKYSAANLASSDVDGGWCAGATGWAYRCCTFSGSCGGNLYSTSFPTPGSCPFGQAPVLLPFKRCF